ncbi:phage tail tip lysozyme [Kitasatospora acidiphila]|uniref:phage tail tip lysozyme n=1 Tax=Kitasatospora acidiphila TaxID=2567942 RepID=UPI003C76C586
MPEGFRIASAFVEVKPDLSGFREELQAQLEEATAGAEARARVTLDTRELDARADEARARVDALNEAHAAPSVRLDSGDLDARADEARATLDELGERRATAEVRLDSAPLEEGTERAEERLDDLGERTARPRVALDTSEFEARVDAVQARLAALGSESAAPGLWRDANGRLHDSRGRFAAAPGEGGELGDGGGVWSRSFRGGGSGFSMPGEGLISAIMPSPLHAALATGITALLPAVGGAATGLGLLGGVGALGLGGIGKAVSDAHQASLNIGITPQQQAATAFSNSVAQQQAQDQVSQARKQAAQDAITSANGIEQAQMNLASVERNSAEQQVQALQSVKQAEQGVEEANYALSEAQYNLSQAWEAARENLRQLDDQLADNKLGVQQAQLAIQQAEYQQRLTDQNAYSTALDRQQAALAVAQAQQRLTDAQDQLTNSTYAANLAHKQGVSGSQQVIQAQQAVTTAQYGQVDANAQLSDAHAQATLVQLNNADQLKAAQMQLAAASEQAAFQREQDAHSIAVAERNLTDTIREQQLQLAATESTANQAANAFALDMARLSPAAQQVVEKILSMRGAFKQLETTAQTAIAPGLMTLLDGLQSMLPTIEPAIARMGGLLSEAFGSIGKALESSHAQDVFSGLVDNGAKIASTLGPALGGIAGALADIGSQKGAADGLASVIGGLGSGLTGLVTSLSPFVGSLSGLLAPLGQALAPLGGEIGTLVGHLAQSLAPVLQQLLPPLSKLISALVAGLSPVLDAIGPLLTPVVSALSDIFSAIDPLLPVLGNLIGQLAKALAPILQALTPIIQAVADMLAKELQKGLTGMLQALMPLFPPLAQLIVALTPIIDVIVRLAGFILDLVFKIEVPLTQAIVWIISKFAELASHWHDAVNDIEWAATWLIDNVFEPLWSGLSKGADDFVSDFGKAWNGLEDVFKKPVNFLIGTVYTGGIEALWNGVVNALGQNALDLPDIKQLATGGVLPGYEPGRDTIPAMLSPGEGVLVPEAVRALGPGTVLALNAAYGGGRVSTPGHYSGGGIGGLVSDITDSLGGAWHDVTGALGKGFDLAKVVAAVATGDTSGLGNALGKLISTKGAGGNYAKMLLGIPTTLIHDAVTAIGSMFSGGGGNIQLPSGSSSAVGDLPANWQAIASFLSANGFTKFAAAGVAGNIAAESGGNPEILEIGGGGGGGLIQWTPYPRSYITGDYQADLMTQLNAILSWGGGPARVNQATSPSNAAEIYQDEYERPASLTASLPQRMSSANAVAKAMGWAAYDQGGWLPPGQIPVNGLRKPEAVLTSEQWDTLKAVAGQAVSRANGDRQIVVHQHFHGTQWPNAEQKAAMQRELALALA